LTQLASLGDFGLCPLGSGPWGLGGSADLRNSGWWGHEWQKDPRKMARCSDVAIIGALRRYYGGARRQAVATRTPPES
jgi:hypothetical protein